MEQRGDFFQDFGTQTPFFSTGTEQLYKRREASVKIQYYDEKEKKSLECDGD